jgi:hypothetical protein
MAEPKRKTQDSGELWKEVLADMASLLLVYQDHATSAFKSMEPPILGVEAFDIMDLAEPPSLWSSIQRLMTAFSVKNFQECFDNAFDALDYKIADELCKTSRILRVHLRDAVKTHDGAASPSTTQMAAGDKYMSKAEQCLSMWEKMTEHTPLTLSIMGSLSIDTDAMVQLFIRQAFVDRREILVETIDQKIKAVQICRASEQLKDFLGEVKPMMERLSSAFGELEVRQMRELRAAKKRKQQQQ